MYFNRWIFLVWVVAKECLYNKFCTGFRQPEKKKQAWQQIAIEMRIPEEVCIKRWACLRDRYAREKRQLNVPSGSGATIVSHWPLMQTMEFIAPHIVPRATRCSYNVLNELDTDTNSQPSPHSPESSNSPMFVSSPLQEEAENDFTILSSATTPAAAKRKRRRHEAVDEDSEFSDAINIFKNLCEKKMEQKDDEKNPLHGFGQMIVATIQTMSPAKQVRAMQKLMCLDVLGVFASDQYHIQTDEGPERYFRFQTQNGQFRKEKRLQDGTVIGTEAWIDAAGYLRLKDYIADKQGYRILKSKVVYVGQGTEIQDAIKSTKAVAAQTGVLVDGKHGFQNNPNSISSLSSNTYASQKSTVAPSAFRLVSTTTERPILGYLSPAEAAKLEPTPYLGFDHYPNELPEHPKRPQQPVVYTRPRTHYNYQYDTTTESSAIKLPSIEMEPPRENSRRRIRPIAVASAKPLPISGEELNKSSFGYSTPRPFEAVARTTTAPNAGYHYEPNIYSQNIQQPQDLPINVNALDNDLLPPLPPLYHRRRQPLQQNHYAARNNDPNLNDVTVTRNGFRYILPHQYHEEEQIDDSKKAGSFGYVDPFGIRRVVYYNASPEKGFIHRNRNRYVGLDAQPYDEPQPTNV